MFKKKLTELFKALNAIFFIRSMILPNPWSIIFLTEDNYVEFTIDKACLLHPQTLIAICTWSGPFDVYDEIQTQFWRYFVMSYYLFRSHS